MKVHCQLCGYVHPSGYDCFPERRRAERKAELVRFLREHDQFVADGQKFARIKALMTKAIDDLHDRAVREAYAVPLGRVIDLTPHDMHLRGLGVEVYGPVVLTGDRSKLRVGTGVRIDSFVKIEIGEGVYLGDNTHIASFAHLNIGGGRLHIGKRCGIASGAKIVTGGNDVNAESMTATAPASSRTYKSAVFLGDDVSILVNAVVLPGCCLRHGSRLGAGSVMMRSTQVAARELWVGTPARFKRSLQ
jgi:acetyltransferase-like isoleucine patch superfamily enzyme